MRTSIRLLICGALFATHAGCVSTPILTCQPSIDNTERLRSCQDKFDVGRFKAAAGYPRTIRIENSWESSFMGAIAIPAAISGYSATVQKLLGELSADPEFRRATQAGAVAH